MVFGLGFTSSRSLVTGILQSSGLVGLLCGGGSKYFGWYVAGILLGFFVPWMKGELV